MLKLIGTDGRRYYSWNLEPGKYIVGRKPECDFMITDNTVSRKHAQFEIESLAGPCFLVDLESRNGIMVNGQRISMRTEVKPGDHILLGSVELKLKEVKTSQSTGPSTMSTVNLYAEKEPEKSVFLSIDDALQPLPVKVTDRPEVMPTLFEMAKMLVLPEPKEVMLERSLGLVKKVIPAERLAVLLTDKGRQDPSLAACLVSGKSDPGSFTLSRTIVNEILTNNNAVLIDNPEEDPRFAAQESIIMSQLKSAMAVPLFVEGKVLGILYADTSDPRQRYSDEFLRLFATLGNLIAFRLLNYTLLTERQEKQVMESELRNASLIQRNLLRKTLPELGGYRIYAFQEQCRAVGGDLYDLSLLPDGCLLFMVADVSGKGMGAALLMSNILASFRILYDERQFDLLKAVEHVSLQLFNHSAPENFATLFIGLADPKEDTVRFVNAGHNPPVLVRRDGRIEHLEASGTMIGAFDFGGWTEETVMLGEGDLLFVFTDGVTEAERGEELYGDERAERLITNHRHRSPSEIAGSLMDDLKAFIQEAPRSDDITVLLIKKDTPC